MGIKVKEFVDKIVSTYKIEEFCGVSDSTLKHLINYLIDLGQYTPFTNEGDAVAYAAGRTLAGHPTAILMQNSGLTNASSPISSLNSLYKIPTVYIVGWRGCQEFGEFKDEPQHRIVGRNTKEIISSISENKSIVTIDSRCNLNQMIYNNPKISQMFYLITPGTFDDYYCLSSEKYVDQLSRYNCIKKLVSLCKGRDDVVIVSTTGHISRELMSFDEFSPSNFYMLGSMGCIVPFAYGIAKSCPDKKVIILDGDGSLLMRPEGLIVCSQFKSINNVLHIIFNNMSHLSTGGQSLPYSKVIDKFVDSMTYSFKIPSQVEFTRRLDTWLNSEVDNKSTLIVNVNSTAVNDLPRPTTTPEEIADRFAKGLKSE